MALCERYKNPGFRGRSHAGRGTPLKGSAGGKNSSGWLTGETHEEAVRLGWAHGALLTAFPGDTTMATVDQMRAFAQGGSARIQR
jgi:hypothetical protein